jgi:hypothetical protein
VDLRDDIWTIEYTARLSACYVYKDVTREEVTNELHAKCESKYKEGVHWILNGIKEGEIAIIGKPRIINYVACNNLLRKVFVKKVIKNSIYAHKAIKYLSDKIDIDIEMQVYGYMLGMTYVKSVIHEHGFGEIYNIDDDLNLIDTNMSLENFDTDQLLQHLMNNDFDKVVSYVNSVQGKLKGIKKTASKELAAILAQRALNNGCTCDHIRLTEIIYPEIYNKHSLELNKTKPPKKDKTWEQVIKDYVQEAISEVFKDPKNQDARTRIKYDNKNWVQPPPCKIHRP